MALESGTQTQELETRQPPAEIINVADRTNSSVDTNPQEKDEPNGYIVKQRRILSYPQGYVAPKTRAQARRFPENEEIDNDSNVAACAASEITNAKRQTLIQVEKSPENGGHSSGCPGGLEKVSASLTTSACATTESARPADRESTDSELPAPSRQTAMQSTVDLDAKLFGESNEITATDGLNEDKWDAQMEALPKTKTNNFPSTSTPTKDSSKVGIQPNLIISVDTTVSEKRKTDNGKSLSTDMRQSSKTMEMNKASSVGNATPQIAFASTTQPGAGGSKVTCTINYSQ